MRTVTIYTTPTCSQCEKTRVWFTTQGIPFSEHDIIADAEARKRMIEISGSRNVPVIQIGERVLVGFDENEVAVCLAQK